MSVVSPAESAVPTHLVIDASVVIKWHVTENLTAEALKILADDGAVFHVPDLLFPEVGNILWKKVRRSEITAEQCRTISRLITEAPS